MISPLLAKLYLDYVFDLWVDQWRRRHATGDVIMVRYADDSVLGFQYHHYAVAFQQQPETHLAEFDLSLYPQKTPLLRFEHFVLRDARAAGEDKPGSFDFLGFTHLCSVNRLNRFTIRRRTMHKRRVAQLKRIRGELRRRLYDPIARTGPWLQRAVQGHIDYYGVPFNSQPVAGLRYAVFRTCAGGAGGRHSYRNRARCRLEPRAGA